MGTKTLNEPEDDFDIVNKKYVDNLVYNGYEKTLWTGNATGDGINITLSEDYKKYSELDFVFLDGSYKTVINVKTNQFNMDIGRPILVVNWCDSGRQRWMFVNSISSDGKTINVTIRDANEHYLKSIVGYKTLGTPETQEIEDILWNGNLSPAQGTSITTNKDWTEFDYLIFKTFKTVQYMYNKVRVSDLLQTDSDHMIILEDGWDSNLRYLRVWYNSNTKINLDMVDENLIQVIGIKTKATPSLQLKTKIYSGYVANVSGTVASWNGSFTIDDGYQIVSVALATEGFVGVAYIATNGIRQEGNRVYVNGWWSCQWAGSNSGNIGYTAIAMKLE